MANPLKSRAACLRLVLVMTLLSKESSFAAVNRRDAMEGSLLSEQGVIRKAPENYRRAYGNKLSEQVEEIQQFLENHKIEESSQQTLETLRGQLNKLTTLFEAMSEVSDENTLKDIGKQLQSLSSDLQSLEEGL